MNLVDLIVSVILCFYLATGMLKGFLRTLIGPFALVIGTVFAIMYYQRTEDFLWALLISVLAPLTVNLILLVTLKILHKTLGKNKDIGLLSRVGGALLSAVWSGAWIILTLIFLVITPCNWSWFDKLQDNVLQSKTYTLINKVVGDKIPATSMNVHEISEMLQNPRKFRAVKDTAEYKALVENDTIQELLRDQETIKQIENQNIPKLLSNPKFQALLSDKDLIKKAFALQKKLTELENSGEMN